MFALIDTGASRSFVSRRLVARLGLKAAPAESALRVMLPTGRYITTDLTTKLSLRVAGAKMSWVAHIIEL